MDNLTRVSGLAAMLICASLTWAKDGGNRIELRIVPAITDEYILPADAPPSDPGPRVIDMVAAPDEYEPASFVVFAHTPLEDLLVEASPLADAEGNELQGGVLDLRVVKRWYQRNGGNRNDSSMDAVRFMAPELLLYDDELVVVENGRNMLRLQTGEYIDVSETYRKKGFATPRPDEMPVADADSLQPMQLDAGRNAQFWVTAYVPPGAKPGDYSAELDISAGGQSLARLPVRLEVLPFALDEPQVEVTIYYRARLDANWPEGSVSSEYKSKAQMLAELENLREHGIRNPMVYQHLSTGLFDDVLDMREQLGMNGSQLFTLCCNTVTTDGAPRRNLLNDVYEALRITEEFGIEDVYFYARDEAQKDELLKQMPAWELVQEAGGKIMAAGWQTTPNLTGNFDITGAREDLFVMLGTLRLEESQRWHEAGSKIFSYQNPTGGRELPETWRRNYGLLLWQFDFDGGAPYAWQHSYADAWNDFDHYEYKDHNFTYPTVAGPIDTTSWEGLREGIDDLRYLATLNNLLEEAGAGTAAAAARKWLQELPGRPLGKTNLDGIRAEMVGHILAVGGYESGANAVPVEELQVGDVQPDGSVVVSWRTDQRAATNVTLIGSGVRARASESAPIRHHAAQIDGLQPGASYTYSAYSSFDEDGRPLMVSGAIDTSPALGIDAGVTEQADGSMLIVDVGSRYRASIAVDIDRSLQGWWRFSSKEAEEEDLSSWRRAAVLKGDAEVADGWFGNGVALDGADDFVNINSIEIPQNGTATIEGWFKFNSFAMDNQSSMGLFTGFYQHSSNNHFYFVGTNENFEVSSLLRKNTWHHIALTWNGDAGSAVVYIDGRPVRVTIQSEIEAVPEIDGLSIGRHAGYFGGLVGTRADTFDGTIDEVRVWDRVLSPAEIQASYDAGAGKIEIELPRVAASGKQNWKVIGANAADRVAAP